MRRSARRPRRTLWTTVMGLMFVIILIVGVPWWYTSRNSFCNSCHVMKPYYRTWGESTHANVNCVACHSGPGLVGQFRGKVALFRQLVVNVIFQPDSVKAGDGIPNGYCTACHSEHRRPTSGADLKLPAGHHKMVGNPFQCVDCHKELVHDKTPNGKNVVRMKVCLNCHKQKKISVKCVTCHYYK